MYVYIPTNAAVAAIGNSHIVNDDKEPGTLPSTTYFALFIAAAYITAQAAHMDNICCGNKLLKNVINDIDVINNNIFNENKLSIDMVIC